MRAQVQILLNPLGGFSSWGSACILVFPSVRRHWRRTWLHFPHVISLLWLFTSFGVIFCAFLVAEQKHFCNLEIKSNLMVTFVGFARSHVWLLHSTHARPHALHTRTHSHAHTHSGGWKLHMFAFSLHCIFLICFSCFFVFNGCQLPCGVCRVGWSSGRECRLPLVIKRLPFNANCCFSLFLSFSLGNLLSAIELFADNSVYPEGKLNVGERAMVCPSWRTVPNYGMVCALFIVLNSGVLHMGLNQTADGFKRFRWKIQYVESLSKAEEHQFQCAQNEFNYQEG